MRVTLAFHSRAGHFRHTDGFGEILRTYLPYSSAVFVRVDPVRRCHANEVQSQRDQMYEGPSPDGLLVEENNSRTTLSRVHYLDHLDKNKYTYTNICFWF